MSSRRVVLIYAAIMPHENQPPTPLFAPPFRYAKLPSLKASRRAVCATADARAASAAPPYSCEQYAMRAFSVSALKFEEGDPNPFTAHACLRSSMKAPPSPFIRAGYRIRSPAENQPRGIRHARRRDSPRSRTPLTRRVSCHIRFAVGNGLLNGMPLLPHARHCPVRRPHVSGLRHARQPAHSMLPRFRGHTVVMPGNISSYITALLAIRRYHNIVTSDMNFRGVTLQPVHSPFSLRLLQS